MSQPPQPRAQAISPMETFGDKARAFLSRSPCTCCASARCSSACWSRSRSAAGRAAGPVIEVGSVGVTQAPRGSSPSPRGSRRSRSPPKPAPEAAETEPPKPQPQATPPPTEQQDRVNREKIAELAQEKAETPSASRKKSTARSRSQLEKEQKRRKRSARSSSKRCASSCEQRKKRGSSSKQKLAQLRRRAERSKPMKRA